MSIGPVLSYRIRRLSCLFYKVIVLTRIHTQLVKLDCCLLRLLLRSPPTVHQTLVST